MKKLTAKRRRPQLESLEGRTLLNAGDLDLTFGGTGVVTTNLGLSNEGATSVVVQPWDNKVVAASRDGNPSSGGSYKFALARYNTNGTLDTSFGGTGIVTTTFRSNGNTANAFINQVILEGTKILAVGYSYTGGGTQAVAMARYNPDGTLDTTFGSGGEVLTPMSGKGTDYAQVAALDPSGKIVVGGGTGSGAPILLRYTAAGSLDTSFGSKGTVVGTSGSGTYGRWIALQVQPVGTSYQIVAAGFDGTTGHGAIAHYNADGSPVTTFGTNGEVSVAFPGGGTTVPMAFQPDGKLVGAYETGLVQDDQIIVNRYNAAGTPDGGFGTGGQVVTHASSLYNGSQALASAYAVGIDPAGRIVVAGRAHLNGSWLNSLLLRYTSAGAPDPAFGNNGNGAVVTLVGGTLGGEEEGYKAVTFQPDGKIVTAGYVATGYDASTGNVTSFGLDIARYLSDTTTTTTAALSPPRTSTPTATDPLLVPLALDDHAFVNSLAKRKRRHA